MKPLPKRSLPDVPTPWFYRVVGAWMAPLERALGIDCRTFTRLASRRMDGPVGLGERIRYHVHRLTCVLCRAQEARLHRLTGVIHQAAKEQRFGPEGAMPEDAKSRLRERVMEELAKGAGEG